MTESQQQQQEQQQHVGPVEAQLPASQSEVRPLVRLGVGAVDEARPLAQMLARVVEDCRLVVEFRTRAGVSRHIRIEGWLTLCAMLGIAPREVSVEERDGIYTATVELVRITDGAVIARASAECGAPDELDRHGQPIWASRPRFQRRAMAITRATSRACRIALGWIPVLAGYSGTPAEEMDLVTVEAVATEQEPAPQPQPQPQPQQKQKSRPQAQAQPQRTPAQPQPHRNGGLKPPLSEIQRARVIARIRELETEIARATGQAMHHDVAAASDEELLDLGAFLRQQLDRITAEQEV
ncbi:MAG: hypothetical protein KatS3mg059_1810 [Thermomicrobiales bacterium]|nr:MAG: hypothetical protein KatS3mg059_1810 [Thermomicrobiales bacterium]